MPVGEKTDTRVVASKGADWLFLGWIVATLLVSTLFVAAPLIVAVAALLTRLRNTRWKMVTLWVVAGGATLFFLLPFIVILLGFSTTSFVEL